MDKVKDLIVGAGFKQSNNKYKTYSHEFIEGYVMDIEPEYGDWSDVDSVIIRLKSKKFGCFMDNLFKNTAALDFNDIKMKKNNEGIIGVGTVLVEYNKEPIFFTANGEIAIDFFVSRLASITTVKNLYDMFFFEQTNKMLAMLEGVWVQLFFMLEINLGATEIEFKMNNLPSNLPKPNKMNFDINAILSFAAEYKRVDAK